jgi:hypothetical protein
MFLSVSDGREELLVGGGELGVRADHAYERDLA